MKMGYKEKFTDAIKCLRSMFDKGYSDRLVASAVFGSVASDRHSPESDIDLLIILEEKKSSYDEFSYFYDRLEEAGLDNLRINPIFKDKNNLDVSLSFLWSTKFIVLYDKDGTFENFLQKLNNFRKEYLIMKDGYVEVKEVVSG